MNLCHFYCSWEEMRFYLFIFGHVSLNLYLLKKTAHSPDLDLRLYFADPGYDD